MDNFRAFCIFGRNIELNRITRWGKDSVGRHRNLKGKSEAKMAAADDAERRLVKGRGALSSARRREQVQARLRSPLPST